MLQLSFDPRKLPRSMSREEWRKIDRWRRTAQKQVGAEVSRQMEDLGTYGQCTITPAATGPSRSMI